MSVTDNSVISMARSMKFRQSLHDAFSKLKRAEEIFVDEVIDAIAIHNAAKQSKPDETAEVSE